MKTPYGDDLFGDVVDFGVEGVLSKNFIIPPMSVLDANKGYWMSRKKAWKSYGLRGELGRDSGMTFNNGGVWEDVSVEDSTSMFDPVLCEILYRWFCPGGGSIIDPFAGGSTRGIIASFLGFGYWGCDINEKQVEQNRIQGKKITPNNPPVWVCGDSMTTLQEAPLSSMLLTCPPYGDLERYSDNPKDISTMEYHTFLPAYKRILFKACSRMFNHAFACIVVGNFRDKTGVYRNFVGDTINAFRDFGWGFYNDLIIQVPLSTAPRRASGQFEASRKIVKVHQNILVFIKGCPVKATEKILKDEGYKK
jgi:DNA modification methylase